MEESTSAPSKNLLAVVRTQDAPWDPMAPGVSMKTLRSDQASGAATLLVKLDAGASFPEHNHPGGEEVFVLEGDIQLDQHRLGTGDYLYTPPGEKHAVWSQKGCTVFVVVPKPIEILNESR